MDGRIPPRLQGDIGEWSAIGWLIDQGAKVFLPLGHSPDIDLVADFGDRLASVQVKTSTVSRNTRFEVTLATRGGNRSWNGVVKHFEPARCDISLSMSGMGADGSSHPVSSAGGQGSFSAARSTPLTKSSPTAR
jgi:Holliday junction resolvase-like predicted endonuclease